uniref:UPAR/Ly6 domain-containing protein n=1 Tax=Ascaris lumbricoides TaxID=6252 RepID=A0A0M3IFB8_ASCLU
MRFMLLLMSATIGVALECYRGSNLFQELPIHSKTCLENPVYQTRWCIKITNWSNVVRSCDELKMCSMQGNRCVKDVKYGQLRGELCCCDSDYCNAASQLSKSLATVLVATIIALCM